MATPDPGGEQMTDGHQAGDDRHQRRAFTDLMADLEEIESGKAERDDDGADNERSGRRRARPRRQPAATG
jgi:hypothetical protein